MKATEGKKILHLFDQDDINRFTIVQRISTGSMHEICQVIEKETNQKYVFKILKIEHSGQEQSLLFHYNAIKTFVQTAEIISFFDSPFIVKIIGICTNYEYHQNKTAATVLEYCPNGSIGDLIRSKKSDNISSKWNDTRKLICIYGIAVAMSLIHSRDIICVNLKPESILLDENFYPKISDFSTSKINGMNDTFSSQMDTYALGYMAPEVINEGYYSMSADVYSFGIALHVILTGKLPMEGRVTSALKILNSGGKIELSGEIPQCYRNLISKCLLYDPNQRQTFSEIVSNLRNDKSFITETSVDEAEFLEFVRFADLAHPEQKPEEKKLNVDIEQLDLSLFEKKELIGKGSFAKVYKIVENKTAKNYAAKINRKELELENSFHLCSISSEINILSKLNSNSILRFIGYNENDFDKRPRPTIITELVRKGSLDHIIEQERNGLSDPKWDDTKKLINIYGIAFGMSYLHSLNILHRDLKPANILLNDSLFPKIGDFGLSREVVGTLNESEYVGTPVYWSPEYLKNAINHKPCDVYAFALIVYEMLTLKVPFKDCDYVYLLLHVTNGYRPEIDSNIPDCYRELIQQCWSQDPSERPTFDEIVERLRSNPEFITDTVDQDEFFRYTEYLMESNTEKKDTTTTDHDDVSQNVQIVKPQMNSDKSVSIENNLNQQQEEQDHHSASSKYKEENHHSASSREEEEKHHSTSSKYKEENHHSVSSREEEENHYSVSSKIEERKYHFTSSREERRRHHSSSSKGGEKDQPYQFTPQDFHFVPPDKKETPKKRSSRSTREKQTQTQAIKKPSRNREFIGNYDIYGHRSPYIPPTRPPATGGQRGFKGILLSSIFGKCKVPFQCSPQPVTFKTDGNTYFIEIVDGYGQFADIENISEQTVIGSSHDKSLENSQVKLATNTPNIDTDNSKLISTNSNSNKNTVPTNSTQNETNSEKYGQIIYANEHHTKGTKDKDLIFKITCIVEHFKVVCMALYDSPVTKINLSFGVENDQIYLLDGDVTTTPNSYVSYLFRDVEGGEETFVDYFVSSVLYEPSRHIETSIENKRPNTDSNYESSEFDTSFSLGMYSTPESSYSNHDKILNTNTEKVELNTSQKNKPLKNHEICYSNFNDCLEGKYKCPLLYVMYYFAKQTFTQIDPDKLYTLLKIRLFKTKTDKDVNICVRCVHIYLDEKRDHQIVKKEKDYLDKKNIPTYNGYLFIKEPMPPEIKVIKGRVQIHSKKAPKAIQRMADGKPSHHLNDLYFESQRNNEDWNVFYDNLTTKKKLRSTSFSYSLPLKSGISRQLKVKSKKKIDLPEFAPNDTMALKKAPFVFGNNQLNRKSWVSENIVRRFHYKKYSPNDPQYIEPRNIHITEI